MREKYSDKNQKKQSGNMNFWKIDYNNYVSKKTSPGRKQSSKKKKKSTPNPKSEEATAWKDDREEDDENSEMRRLRLRAIFGGYRSAGKRRTATSASKPKLMKGTKKRYVSSRMEKRMKALNSNHFHRTMPFRLTKTDFYMSDYLNIKG